MISVKDVIAPSFYRIFNAVLRREYTHYWLKGERGSTKSSFASIVIILQMLQNSELNTVVIRRYANTLKDSVHAQLEWAAEKLGVSELWNIQEKYMTYLPTGQKIIFRGADKPTKLRSIKVTRGYIGIVWYEEVHEFEGIAAIRDINRSMLRGGNDSIMFYTFNPPPSSRSWINSELTTPYPDRYIHHSDYTTVPPEWLGEKFIIEAEHLKSVNPAAYAHEYLGEVTGTGAEVFTNVEIREISDLEIEDFDVIVRGIDWGYAGDPFVYIEGYFDKTRKRLYILHEFVKLNASFESIAEHILARDKIGITGKIIADTEARSNAELTRYGIKIEKASKPRGSVEHGTKWLQGLEAVIIDPVRCPYAKWGGVPVGITQNVKDLLMSAQIESIFENTEFYYLLNQAPGDLAILMEKLKISPGQAAYVTNSDAGCGLIKFDKTILPFEDKFPTDTAMYKLMTTKPAEM